MPSLADLTFSNSHQLIFPPPSWTLPPPFRWGLVMVVLEGEVLAREGEGEANPAEVVVGDLVDVLVGGEIHDV